jgi:outer membrane protein OmpA-like peptidoglycan-associated protein
MKMDWRKSSLIAVLTVSLAGCAQNSQQVRDAQHAGAVALGAVAGIMLGNQFSDNPVVKGALGVAGGYIAHKMYQDLNKDFQNDPNVEVKPVTVDGKNAINVSLRNVHFAVNSASLSYEDMQKLDKVIETIRGQNVEVLVVGHTDSSGPADYNVELSLARANSVKEYMVHKGIPAYRITTRGKGEMEPIADNSTPEGRAMNRRVEIYLVPNEQTQFRPQSGHHDYRAY